MNPKPTKTLVIAMAIVTTLAPGVLAAEPAAQAAPDARAILAGMARFLASQPRFAVEIESAYDAVQESGQEIEFMEEREVLVDRPGRMRIDVEQSDGDRSSVLVDGKTVTAYSADKGVYAQTPAKGSLDDTIVHFVRDLKMKLPLAMLLMGTLEQELDARVVEADVVESTSILGEPAYHVVASTDSIDFQVWVAAGKQPLPQRVVITYREETGMPQYRANFDEWDLSPRVRDSAFEFEVPKGAQRIAFINQVPPVKASSAVPAPAGK